MVFDSVAQLVEQYTFNVWALGSSPSGITKRGCLKRAASFSVSGMLINYRVQVPNTLYSREC